jgi:hypothetical protein
MTLADLFSTITPQLPANRVKDVKTSVRYLAHALGRPSPDHCYAPDYLRPLPELIDQLNTFLAAQGASSYTVKNTRSNIRLLLGRARAHGLLPVETSPPQNGRMISFREAQRTNPHRDRFNQHGYGLRLAQWPPALQRGWEAYARDQALMLSPYTLLSTRQHLESYVGFLLSVAHAPIRRWADLFQPRHVRRFVEWHCQRFQVRMTAHAYRLVQKLRAIANVQHLAHAEALHQFLGKLPPEEKLHQKQEHWVSRAQLEQVALRLRAEGLRAHAVTTTIGHRHGAITHPGLARSLCFQRALILRLLVRVPLRQQNVRDLKRESNLYRDGADRWQVRFSGHELKVAWRNGQVNTFSFPWPEDLIADLDDFLTKHRPRFPHHDERSEVFLTRFGNPFNRATLRNEIHGAVLNATGKRFYPHLIRTIWATEAILEGETIDTVAFWLNDRIETVWRDYHELLSREHLRRGQAFATRSLTAHPPHDWEVTMQ